MTSLPRNRCSLSSKESQRISTEHRTFPALNTHRTSLLITEKSSTIRDASESFPVQQKQENNTEKSPRFLQHPKSSANSRWNCECFVPSRHSLFHRPPANRYRDRQKRSTYGGPVAQCICGHCHLLVANAAARHCWSTRSSTTIEGAKANLSFSPSW